MPKVTQYIRDEDLSQWNQIENKSLWIHERLNEAVGPTTGTPPNPIKNFDPLIKITSDYPKVETALNLGRACCLLKTPCAHWRFDDGVWTNSLTGETKEVV